MDWPKIKQDREDYFEKLRKWLDDARLWYSLSASFPNSVSGIPFPDGVSNNQQQTPVSGLHGTQFRNNQQAVNGNVNNATFNGVPFYQTYPFILPPNLLRLPTTYEFRIPPLWKRLFAEFIDFCLLFILKLVVNFLFLESSSIGNALENFDFDAIQKTILEGQELNFPFAYELALLEILHRFVVCAFETYFLHGNACATPGKRCMGLMVVTAETLTQVPNRPTETVSATGVKAPGWQRALLRAVLKNFIVGLLLPICVIFHVFPFNRTSYDMMVNTLVVEEHQEFLLYQALIAR